MTELPTGLRHQYFPNLGSWVKFLRDHGELVDIHATVDPYLEVTEIADRMVKAGGPALLFHHVGDAQHPMLINQFGSERRMCMALGVDSLDTAAARLSELMEMNQPFGFSERIRGMAKVRRLSASQPTIIDRPAPCQQEVVEPDLDRLPIQHCWPGDPAPFMTFPLVITADPVTKSRNVGIYRMQKINKTSTFMHWQVHKDGAADWRASTGRLDVAVVLGSDPVLAYVGSVPLPKGVDEFALAGMLTGRPVEMVRCRTIDLEVPAHSEIILEGYVDRDNVGLEGPFGDHTGYYSPAEFFPVFHVTAMTMRPDAIYPSIVVGPPPAEDAWLSKTTERLFLPALRLAAPEVVDYDLPIAGAFQHIAIVSIRKSYPGQARKVIHAMWGSGLMSLLKSVVVVDDFINPHDYAQVFFHVCANVDPIRDLVLTRGPIDQLDHSSDAHCYGGKVGIDATHKLPSEASRAWPERIVMTDAIRRLVDVRWEEYGIRMDVQEDPTRSGMPF